MTTFYTVASALFASLSISAHHTHAATVNFTVDWNETLQTFNTYPTYQIVVNPLITRYSPIHDETWKSIAALNASFVRMQYWFPYPQFSVAQLQPPSDRFVCGHLNGNAYGNNWNLTLQCPYNAHSIINKIDFVSFGTPSGWCGNFSVGECNADANLTMSVVQKLCLHQNSCEIPVNTATFGGDPCPNTRKSFAIQVECSDVGKGVSNWNFTEMDKLVQDYFHAVNPNNSYPNKTVLDFSSQPNWKYVNVSYQAGINDDLWNASWGYAQGTTMVDPTAAAIGEYFGKLAGWYAAGGFTDIYGNELRSEYAYDLGIWEVLNEPDAEHENTVETYTKIYDETVEAIWKYAYPQRNRIKFMGLALEGHDEWNWYEYFLNSSNHKSPDIPLDYISFHFYAHTAAVNRTNADSYSEYFPQADTFVVEVENITKIRDRLSPNTKMDIDELGVILGGDNAAGCCPEPPPSYYVAAGGLWAYCVLRLSLCCSVDIVGQSQLMGYPTLNQTQFPMSETIVSPQYPSVSMIDWNTGVGNAKYWILKLFLDHLSVRDEMVQTQWSSDNGDVIYLQAFVTLEGAKILVCINKMNEEMAVYGKNVNVNGGTLYFVDTSTGNGPAKEINVEGDSFTLAPYAVAVLYLND